MPADRPQVVVFSEAEDRENEIIAIASALRKVGISVDLIVGGSAKKRFDKAQGKNPDLLFIIRPPVSQRPNWNPIYIDVKRGKGNVVSDSVAVEQSAKQMLEEAANVVPLTKDETAFADFGVLLKSR